MEQTLPKILWLRVERILKQGIKQAYRTEDPNVARVVLRDDSIVYIDLLQNKELHPTQIKILTEKWGKEDTDKLLGQKEPEAVPEKPKGNYASMISRDKALPVSDEAATQIEEDQGAKHEIATKKDVKKPTAKKKK